LSLRRGLVLVFTVESVFLCLIVIKDLIHPKKEKIQFMTTCLLVLAVLQGVMMT